MKVLINALSLKARMGGGVTFGLGLARALQQSAGTHEIVLLGHEGNADLLESCGCPVARAPGNPGHPARRIWFEHTALPDYLARVGADVYVALDGIMPGGLNAATVAILQNALYFNRSQVLKGQSLSGRRRVYLNLQAQYFLRGWRRTARHADACVFVSESLRAEFVSRFTAMTTKAHVIGEAPDPVFAPGPPPGAAGEAYLLGVGTLYPYKRFDLIIRLLALLSDHPRLTARIAGPDWGEERTRLLRLADSLGVADRVEFLGHRTAKELADLYRGALCVCMFSDFESFGLPLVEAMASGTPILVARRSAMPEVGGDAVFARDGDSMVPFAGHVRRLLSDEAYRAEWSSRALDRARAFTWSAIASSYWRLFDDLRQNRAVGRGKKMDAPQSVQKVS